MTDETFVPQTATAVNRAHSGAGLTERELDKLPFGAIQLDTNGRILSCNGFEWQISGASKEQEVGTLLFTEIAPCTNVKELYGRFKEGAARKRLHQKFRYHYSFKGNPLDFTITLFYSALTQNINAFGVWFVPFSFSWRKRREAEAWLPSLAPAFDGGIYEGN